MKPHQAVTDDLLNLDAPLAIHLFNWAWWYDPQWEWAMLYPPDHSEWQRYNFPDNAEYIGTQLDGQKLSPSWWTGGVSQSGKQGVPRFSRDWAMMQVCVSAMKERGYSWQTADGSTPAMASATFFLGTGVWRYEAETVPKATAHAALLALKSQNLRTATNISDMCHAMHSISRVSGNQFDENYSEWSKVRGVGTYAEGSHMDYIHELSSRMAMSDC